MTNVCIYKIKKGKDAEFLKLLKKHWPTLHSAGLATDTPATAVRGTDKTGQVTFVETFAWKDRSGPRVAHETPEVMQVWEPMGALCDDMQFLDVEPVSL